MLRFDVTSSPFLLSVSVLLLVFLAVWSFRTYRNTYYPQTVKHQLFALRLFAMVIFLMILADVSIDYRHDKKVRPEIAVLWDLSESMVYSDSAFDVRSILTSGSFKDLNKHARLTHIAGMDAPGIIPASRLLNRPVNEVITDNGRLLRFADEQKRFRDLILISDGNSYLGESIENIDLSRGLIVHAIGVGKGQRQGKAFLRTVHFPEYNVQGDSIRADWTVQNDNTDSLAGDLIVKKDDQELFREFVSISPQRFIAMSHRFPPGDQGFHEYTWFIETDGRERAIGSKSIRVHPSTIHVVWIADPPDRDVAMITTVLEGRKRYKVYDQNEWQTEQGSREPDLVVRTSNPDEVEKPYGRVPAILINRVNSNTYHTASNHKVIRMKPYVYFSTDLGENSRYWSQLPPVQVVDITPAGKVVVGSEKGRPLIVEDQNNRAIIINAAGLWRWNLAGYEKDWDGLYPYLIEGMAEALTRQTDKDYFSLDNDVYSAGEFQPFELSIERFDNAALLQNDAFIRLTLLDSVWTEFKRKDLPRDESQWELSLDQAGQYFIKADLYEQQIIIESDTADIHVVENNMEALETGCDSTALKTLAEKHNGNYLHLNDLDELAASVSLEKQWTRVQSVFIARNTYLLYFLMLVLLVADWVIRKRHGGM